MVCWHSDQHADYLELEIEFENEVVLQRQLLLLREDELFLVMDSISSMNDFEIEYRCEFPLPPSITTILETKTREVYLSAKKIQSLVLPLSLPEWLSEKSPGLLTEDDGKLLLEQRSSCRGMFTGLAFDLNPRRSRLPRTWRQLTVAESLQPVASDEAVAFRIRIGDDQWVLYRCIGEKRNRTFFGVNFADDFFVGRLQPNGKIKPLLQIE